MDNIFLILIFAFVAYMLGYMQGYDTGKTTVLFALKKYADKNRPKVKTEDLYPEERRDER